MNDAPPLEDRLQHAMAAVTPGTDPDAVLVEVRRRRARRRRRRLVRRAATATTLVAASCVVLFATVLGDRPSEVRTTDAAAPAAEPGPTATPPSPSDRVTTTEVPGRGGRVTPLTATAEHFWVSRGPSSSESLARGDVVTRFDIDGDAGPSTELRGTAIAATADQRALWVLVEEPAGGSGAAPLRLKEIDPADGRLRASHVVPLAGAPIGITATGGGLTVHSAGAAVRLDHRGVVLGPDAEVPGPTHGARQVLRDGDVTWVLGPGDRVAALRAGRSHAASELVGVRRLVPATGPGARSGTVLAEVTRGRGSDLVELEMDGDRVARRTVVSELDGSGAVAALDAEGLWSVSGTELRHTSLG